MWWLWVTYFGKVAASALAKRHSFGGFIISVMGFGFFLLGSYPTPHWDIGYAMDKVKYGLGAWVSSCVMHNCIDCWVLPCFGITVLLFGRCFMFWIIVFLLGSALCIGVLRG